MEKGLTYGGDKYRYLKTVTLYVFRTAFFLLLWVLLQNNSHAQVTADFSASITQGCSPLVVCFTDLSTGNPDTWLWSFGNSNFSPDHNPCAIYIVPGIYTVELTASNGSGSDTKTVTAMITVFANPVADFSASSAMGCAPETISFTDHSTLGDAPLVSWRWDFGDGNTSTMQNPTNIYTNPGAYTVVLEVTDANGCTNSKSVNMITILAAPIVDFTITGGSCTLPANLQFTDQTTGTSITDYQWNFGDGNTSTLQNPTHTYSGAGPYSVTLNVTNSAGCVGTKTMSNVSGSGGLQADFSVDDTDGCGSVSPNFTDQSTSSGTLVDWAWDFGDGGTSNVQNTTHNYTIPGTYDVSLTVTDNNGCSNTVVFDDLITVYVRPAADFTADQTQGCITPFRVNFTETASDDVSWLWEFGDGATSTLQNPSHDYTNPGSYGVRLTVTSADGCTRSHFKANYIKVTSPKAGFWADATGGCLDLTVKFYDQTTSTSPISSWNWNFGDGGTSTQENPTHIYTTTGVFDVRLIIANADGCRDTIIKTGYISTGQVPNIDFGSDKQFACYGTPITFYDSSDIGDGWLWDFGDGTTDTSQNPTHQYGTTGIFSVTLIVFSNGCSDTLRRTGFVTIRPPKPGFIATFSCTNPLEVTFKDISLGANRWHWDFGDGATSTTQDNVHTYASTGNYPITLAAEEVITGCKDTLTRAITVTDPVADFSGTPLMGCAPLIVNFTSASIDADSFQWFFGDGDTSSQENPIKIYDSTGVFDVTLIITDIHGCSDTIVKDDYVTTTGIHAWFAADTLFGCTPLNVDYIDSSTSYLGTITSWVWDFGDNDSSTLQNPSKVYTEPGIYSIGLRVTDSNGCVDSVLRVNYIIPTYPLPDFYADDTIVCVGEDVVFSNLSIGRGMNFLWSFGDGNTSTDSLPVHAYGNEGVYTVSLKATDENGCDSTLVKPLYIRVMQPHAAITVDSTFASCPPLWAHFTDLTPVNDSIVAWQWNFGDAQTSDLQHPIHVYTESDTFLPSLEVTDFNGCKDTAFTPPIVVTGPRGTFDFIQDKWCVPVPVPFFSDAADTMILIYDFGDGSIGVHLGGDTIGHDYTYPGIFHPSLVIDDGHGCVISIDHPDSVITFTVVADFSSDLTAICHANMVHFYDSSYGVQDPVAWFWDFGDGNTSNLQNPTHYYSVPGTYDVMMVITNPQGCTDTMIKPHYIAVDPGPTADFTFSNDRCVPATIGFTDASVSDSSIAIVSWRWDFGDGGTDTLQNPSHIYTTVGTFNVTLIIETIAGCGDTVNKAIVTHGPPIANAGPDKAICIGDTTSLQGSGGLVYSWSPAATLSDANISNPLAFPDTTTTYTLTVYDSIGCSDTDDVTVVVHPLPIVGSTDAAVCVGDSAQLTASGGVSYSWSPAATLSNPNISNPVASPVSTTNYSVTVTDINGCVNTVNTNIVVHPLPIPSVSATNNFLCTGQSVQLNATGGILYNWSPSTWLNDPNIPNPVSTPPFTATYVVTVTDSNGCVNRDTISINVDPEPNYTISPDVTICSGDSTDFEVTGGTIFNWYPATGLSCTTCSNPSASPDSTTTYYVDITNAVGCTKTDSITVTVNQAPVITLSADTGICYSQSYQINASATGSLAWTPSSSLSCNNCPNPVATPDSTTTYTLTVTSENECVSSDSLTVVVRQLNARAFSLPRMACVPATIQFSDSSTADGVITSWNWNFGDGTTSSIQNPQHDYNTPGIYPVTLTIQSSYGCIDSVTNNVFINPLPVANAGPDTTICTGDTAFLHASGGMSYLWSPASSLSNASISNPMAFPTNTTDYTVVVTDKNGCTDSDIVRVNVNPRPVVTLTSDATICATSPIHLNATGGVTYNWSPPNYLSDPNIPDPTAFPIISTTYTVLVTDSNGCQNTGVINLSVNPLPLAHVSPDAIICKGNSVQLWADGGVTYIWSPDSTLSCADCANPVATPSEPTTYQVNIINGFGCMVTKFVTVSFYAPPIVVAGPDTAICRGASVQLYGSGAGSGGSYHWSPSAELSMMNVPNPVATPSATRYYELTITDIYGCKNSDSVLIVVNDFPQTTISAGSALCYGDSTQLEVTGGYSYSWSPAESLSNPTISNPIATPLTTTIYVVNIATESGCNATDSVMVIVRPRPLIIVKAADEICLGDSTQFDISGASDYEWYPATGLSCFTCPNPIAKPDISTSYLLRMTDSYSCIWYDTIPLIVNPIPAVHTTDDKTICKGESVELTTQQQGATSFEWLPPYGLNATDTLSPIASPQQTTEYIIIARNEFGCPARDSVIVNVLDRINTTVTDNLRICSGNAVTIESRIDQSGITGASVMWLPQDAFDDPTLLTQVVSPDTSTTYMMVAYGGACLPDTQYVNVHVDESPDVEAGEDQIVMKGTEVTFAATSNYNIASWYWSPSAEVSCYDCQTTTHIANESRTFYINVTDENGCPAVDSVKVRVITTCDGNIWVPNAFTPNGDETNDEFRVRNTGMVELISFRVFDRWGNLVYRNDDDFSKGWDGKYHDTLVNPDVYVWWVRASCPDGQIVDLKGNVTAIR